MLKRLYLFFGLVLFISNVVALEPTQCPNLSKTNKYGADWRADPFPPYPLTDSSQILEHNHFFQARWARLWGGYIECMYWNEYGKFSIMTIKPRNNPNKEFPLPWPEKMRGVALCTSNEANPKDCPFN